MSGKPITDQQIRLYMNERKQGQTQLAASAKSGLSERSGRRIDSGELNTEPTPKRQWRTRKDPLAEVWSSVLVPLLEANPELLPLTLFEYLHDNYPNQYDNTVLRARCSDVSKHGRSNMAPQRKSCSAKLKCLGVWVYRTSRS